MNSNKNTLAPVHLVGKRSESINSVRSAHKNNGSPQMSLFSWLDFEKASKVNSATESMASERPPSQLSNFSGVDDDFTQNVNRADTVDSGNFSLDTKRASTTDYHKIIVDLNNELLNTKTENIQLKFKLDESKAIMEMEWTEKVRRLSNENRNILEQKINLEKINEEIRHQLNLLKTNYSVGCNSNQLNELHRKIEVLESERDKDELDLFQSRNMLQDLQIKLETKEKASQNLKEQIIEMHTKSQDLVIKMKRLENENATMSNEIEMLKKSESWYKNELHECQNKKLKLQEDLMNTKNELQAEKNKNNKLYTEFTQLLRNCEDIEAKAVREKESMMRKLENIQANLGAAMDKNHLVNHVKDVSDKHEAMNCIEELRKEKASILHKSEQQNTIIQQLEQRCKMLTIQESTIQKQYSEYSIINSLHETKIKEQEENIRLLESQCESLNYQNLDLKAENERLTVHFDSMSKEKEKIDETVQKLREDFEIIMDRFQQLNGELSEKDQIISNMTVETKLLQEKIIEANEIKNISTENQLLKSDLIVCENRIANLSNEITNLKRDLNQKEAEIIDLKNKIGIKVQEIDLLSESNQLSKQEITQLMNQLQSAFNEIKAKNNRISSLLEMNQSIEDNFKSLKTANDDLQGLLKRSKIERNTLKEQLTEAYEKLDIQIKQQAEIQLTRNLEVQYVDKAVDVDFVSHEIESLKAEIEIIRTDFSEKLSKSEMTHKNLFKKLKEEIKQKKLLEQKINEKNDLTLVNAETQARLALSNNKCVVLESKCTNLQNEIDKLEKELNTVTNFLKDNNLIQNDDLIVSIMQLIDEINLSKSKVLDYEETIKKFTSELGRKSSDLEKLQKENETLKSQVKSINNSVASIANYEAHIIGLNSCVEAKTSEIESLSNELQSLHNTIKSLTQKCDELKLNHATASSQNIELSDTITDLRNQLHSSGLEIQILEEKCESYKNIERNLVQSKEQVVRDMQQLRKELSYEHGEKMELQKLVTELKYALSQVMDGIGNGKEAESKVFASLSRKTDFSKTIEILEKSAKTKSTSLAPLQECVDSLKQEMDALNRMIRQNSQIRSEITELSLMDELRAVSER